MKPVIAVPSYKRSGAKIFDKLVTTGLKVYVFVRKDESSQYRSTLPNSCIVVQLKQAEDIGSTRAEIVDYFIRKGINWVFMFDDDISKVEMLKEGDNGVWNSARILDKDTSPPRFEIPALKYWYQTAVRHKLSLSAPIMRFNRADKGNHVYVNRRDCIQCVLVNVLDVKEVDNYKSTLEVGAEDVAIQYNLMKAGYNLGAIGRIEYDCPSVGEGAGGNNSVEESDLTKRYSKYVEDFYDYMNPDPKLVEVRLSKRGVPSIKFIWKNWEGIKLEL